MNKKIFITVIYLMLNSVNSQSIISLETDHDPFTPNVYFKDVSDFFLNFNGTFQHVNGEEKLTIVLKKITSYYNGINYKDLIIGELKFEIGVLTIIDNLNKINQNLPNKYLHDIVGNSVLQHNHLPKCPDCSVNEKRVRLIYFGKGNNNIGGNMVIRVVPTLVGEAKKIKVTIYYDHQILENNEIAIEPFIKSGDYILTKID